MVATRIKRLPFQKVLAKTVLLSSSWVKAVAVSLGISEADLMSSWNLQVNGCEVIGQWFTFVAHGTCAFECLPLPQTAGGFQGKSSGSYGKPWKHRTLRLLGSVPRHTWQGLGLLLKVFDQERADRWWPGSLASVQLPAGLSPFACKPGRRAHTGFRNATDFLPFCQSGDRQTHCSYWWV